MSGKNGGKSEKGLQALASGTLSIARAHAAQVLEKTEAKLERELQRENEQLPSGNFARKERKENLLFRRGGTLCSQLEKELRRENALVPSSYFSRLKRKGEGFLHSKHVLLCVVILNVLDCMLVLGELILDIHYVVDVLHTSETRNENFLTGMQTRYPGELDYVSDVSELYGYILQAQVHWSENITSFNEATNVDKHSVHRRSALNLSLEIGDVNVRGNSTNIYQVIGKPGVHSLAPNNTKNNKTTGTIHHHHPHLEDEHPIEEILAHAFHKASITILAILVLETFMKIIFIGKHMLENKVEVFDGFVVFVSFILDLVFIKGLTVYKIQDFVFILAFLVPWRVLRVVNSLVVAVMDHEHFRLKVLYKQKKEISANLKDAKAHVKSLEQTKEILEKMCLNAGISVWDIRQALATVSETKVRHKSSTGSYKGLGCFSSSSTPLIEKENNNTNVDMSLDAIKEHCDK